MEEESHCSITIALSNLICEEDPTHSLKEKDKENSIILSTTTFVDDNDNHEYVESLISRETAFDRTGSSSDTLSAFARSDCVAWILRMKARFGFGYQTAYLAMAYFDRFFLRLAIDEDKIWAIKLLSVACLSLAAKMEEFRPPTLSEYTIDHYQFGSDAIQRMELLVLNTLEWRMSSVTPFAYLGYFASKFCCDKGPKDFCSRAIGFVFAAVEGIGHGRVLGFPKIPIFPLATNSLDYCPSTIALAAVLAATDDQLAKKSVEVKMRSISLPESSKSEHVFSCYTLMIHEGQRRKLKQTKLLDSSEPLRDFGSIDNSIDASNKI